MWPKRILGNRTLTSADYRIDDFQALLRYVDQLATHKMGYPVSLLTYLGIVDNNVLGIKQESLANVLLNNVGDPFKDSETSLLEVKRHEREIITILERFYGLKPNTMRGYVTTGGTEGNFAALWWSKRYLINEALDELIKYDDKVKVQEKEELQLTADLNKIPLNAYQERMVHLQKILDLKNSATENKAIVQQLLTPTVFYSKGHTHYSVPKIAEILRLNIRPVPANPDGSINLAELKKMIIFHLQSHPHSAIAAIANIGTTITGAIDDVPGIRQVLDEVRKKTKANVPTTIHMDGALTGFVLPILKPFGEVENYFTQFGVNTLAVSAHKYPGLSQPCGIVLAQGEFFKKAFEKSERNIEYVGNIIDVTISGSRSGLNVLMFYNALCALGINKSSERLKQMVQENLDNARYLYDKLVMLYGANRVSYPFHFNVIFPKPSKEMAQKYQLMITGENATICVLANVNKRLIDQFIEDLIADVQQTTLPAADTIRRPA